MKHSLLKDRNELGAISVKIQIWCFYDAISEGGSEKNKNSNHCLITKSPTASNHEEFILWIWNPASFENCRYFCLMKAYFWTKNKGKIERQCCYCLPNQLEEHLLFEKLGMFLTRWFFFCFFFTKFNQCVPANGFECNCGPKTMRQLSQRFKNTECNKNAKPLSVLSIWQDAVEYGIKWNPIKLRSVFGKSKTTTKLEKLDNYDLSHDWKAVSERI